MEAIEIKATAMAHSLIGYATTLNHRYQTGAPHRQIARALLDVERGAVKRLIITVPPRHGKSMLASEYFPAWYLGRNPDKYIIAATYAQELADDFGRKVRDQMLDSIFKTVFPGSIIRPDSSSVKRFNTDAGGAYYAVGVGGPVTGRGAHLLLIDDPIKNREEAESDLIRKRIRDWYQSVAYTRLMPGGAVVVIMTRWHDDDLAGWLLREHAHEGWTVVDLPAVTDGGALWPEAYPMEQLEKIRRAIGERDWNALYMQRPAPDEGDFFKREWFKRYDKAPDRLHVYGASDYAVTDGGGDFTELGMFGVDSGGNIYILDWWSGKTTPDFWIDSQIELIAKHKPLRWFGESGVIQKAIEPFLTKRMHEKNTHCYTEWLPSIADKATRARGFQARASMGKVHIPKTAWGDDLLSQLLRFPAGINDDKVDVCSLIGRGLDQIHGMGVRAPVAKPKAYESYTHKDKKTTGGNFI